jgi:uncharacterized protein YceH (UPF0502 family)
VASDPTAPSETWQPLSLHERRVLGVLVEKQKTAKSLDAYPLTLNALVAGCNQKSNRDPVLELADLDVEETLEAVQQKGLVLLIQGGRVDRWRHDLYTAWRVGKVELALLAELLLRGPQTEGELRGRVSRMEPVEDLDTLRTLLKPLAQRGLVVYLTPEGRRGTVLTHGFHLPAELTRYRAQFANAPLDGDPADPPPRALVAPTPPPDTGRLDALERALVDARAHADTLRGDVASLRAQVARLEAQLRSLHQALGVEPSPPA